jgi:nitroimidazol reductase NimA-like FMN-containing flavoprotein (pyridoxamine 5'-phosphate oxidase superfamily)
MLIEAMTAQECWTMLARDNLARLACARDNQPDVVPVRVDLDGEFLYGYATLGRKIEWMRTNPLVCLEYEEIITRRQWGSLIVFGRYEELPHTPDHYNVTMESRSFHIV